jgi:hypothetical protein
VAPTGSALGSLPAFPMLAALPAGAKSAGSILILVMAVPYLAGIFTGIVTVRVMPTPATEAAALWGFVAGAAAGALAGLAAAFSGGPLGDGRLAAVGPSGWQVGLVAILEIGVTAALTAAAANWLMLRRVLRHSAARTAPADDQLPLGEDPPLVLLDPPAAQPGARLGVVDEREDVSGHRIYLNPWAGHEEPDEPDDLDAFSDIDAFEDMDVDDPEDMDGLGVTYEMDPDELEDTDGAEDTAETVDTAGPVKTGKPVDAGEPVDTAEAEDAGKAEETRGVKETRAPGDLDALEEADETEGDDDGDEPEA